MQQLYSRELTGWYSALCYRYLNILLEEGEVRGKKSKFKTQILTSLRREGFRPCSPTPLIPKVPPFTLVTGEITPRLLIYQHTICEHPPFTPPACLDHRLCTGIGGLLLKTTPAGTGCIPGKYLHMGKKPLQYYRVPLCINKALQIFFPHKLHLKSLPNIQNHLCFPHNQGWQALLCFLTRCHEGNKNPYSLYTHFCFKINKNKTNKKP